MQRTFNGFTTKFSQLTVHQMCRFHLTYPAHGHGSIWEARALLEEWSDDWDGANYYKACDEECDFEEMFIGTGVTDADIREEDVTGQVELKKAINMLSSKGQTHCEDCEPLFVDSLGSREWCTCDVYSRFVEPWRCISCVLAEETDLVVSQQKYTMTYDPTETRRGDWAYDRVNIACPIADNSMRALADSSGTGDVVQMWQTRRR